MSIDLVMPKLGLTMTEGTIQEWIQKPGEPFKKGAVLLVVETEKIANEVEATSDGVIDSILVQAGDTVACGQTIAKWSSNGGRLSHRTQTHTSEANQHQAAAPSAKHEIPPPPGRQGATLEDRPPPPSAGTSSSRPEIPPPPLASDQRVVSTPYARKLARELGVDLSTVSGTGPRGRIKGPDVENALRTNGSQAGASHKGSYVSTSLPPPSFKAPHSGVQELAGTTNTNTNTNTSRRPATRFEKTAAERLTAAKQVPHFYLASEVEISALETLRKQLNGLERKPKVSVTHLLLAALARTLHDHPRANEVYEAGELVRFGSIDIALAVSTERGLLAPLVRDLGNARIHDIADKTREIVERARDGKLRQEDFGGGATSLSNAGMHDVTYMTSIITPGHSSIFGIGSVREVFRPSAKGEPVLKRELGIVMSCDHRVHDGVGGLAILNRLKFYLENPLQIVI
jgi:pyruvate dehydrogenase E2 component (dihydrolipoamide acetyltransferase)